MKKQSGYLRRLTALMLMLCMLVALTSEIFAADIVASGYCGGEGDGTNLTWTLDSEGTLTISGKGKMADFNNHVGESYSYGELEPWIAYKNSIKKLVLGRGLTSIGAEAFCGSYLYMWQELEIPDGVVSIGDWGLASSSFYGNLRIPDSVVSIGDYAFYHCGNFTGSLTIPDSVVSIGDYAFYDCTGFSGDLNIGDGVVEIGERAFESSGFTGSLNIGSSVSTIGWGAFEYAKFTGSLTIPDSVTDIGFQAFYECTGFDGSLSIGAGIKEIAHYVFYGCTGFTGSLTIPDNVTSISDRTFENCSGFTGNLIIGNGVTSIGYGAFNGCSGFTGNLTIPDSVTSIEAHAFENCSGFNGGVSIGKNVTSIESCAFANCSGISGVYFYGNAPSVSHAKNESRSFPADKTLYYIPGNTGWVDDGRYDSSAGTWNGYKLEIWKQITEDDDPQFVSRTPEPNHYLVDGSIYDDAFATITMKFNREVESVQAGGLNGDFKVVRSADTETVYSLAEGNHADTDVKIDGKTVSIRLSITNLELGKLYFILMDYGVIKFKNTDKSVGVSGTEWKFKYSPESVFHGFTLGKHNNSFSNSNSTKKGEAEYSGFLGITSHKLSDLFYYTLMSHTERTIDRLHIELQLLPGRWNGCCHGISSTMLLAFANKLDLSQFENGVNNYYNMPRPYKNQNFLDLIEYFHLGQDSMMIHSITNDQTEGQNMISALHDGPILLSYRNVNFGHTVLALEYLVTEDWGYEIILYDMNQFPYFTNVFTKMRVTMDFKSFILYDAFREEGDALSYVGYATIDDVNRINPFVPVTSSVQVQSQETVSASDCVDITVPLSAVSYRIQNAEGQTLICDENGNFSGTMEILNQHGFFSGAVDGSGSSWTLTVPASERFEVETEQSGINVGIYTEQGCLVLESEDIRSATFVTNQFIRFGQEGQQKFTCVLSNDLPEDQTVRMAYASAETTGSTQIGLEAGDLLISADKTTLEEAARYVGLEKTELDNISTDDGVIYVPVFSDTEDNDQKITVSLGSMTTVLSAKHALTGQICVAGYRENGQLCSVKFYPAAEKITASVDPGAIRAKVFWLDSSRPVCAAKTIMM